MRRPLDKHIDGQELEALVAPTELGNSRQRVSTEDIRVASRHVHFCADCRGKVSRYQQLADRTLSAQSYTVPSSEKCPHDDDVDWLEVAGGLWPSSKAAQLIAHAAQCDHCGPRLRAGAFLFNDDPTPEEASFLAELKTPKRPESTSPQRSHWPVEAWRFRWMAPALAMVLVVLTMIWFQWTTRPPISGPEFAAFAVHAHQQYAIGNVGLEVHSNSQQALNEWLEKKLSFQVALPAKPPTAGEVRPFEVEGARLIQAAGRSSAFIAYQMDTGPASLIVTPETVAAATGGVEAHYKTVSFHYAMIEGYKVVTWTQHGRSYALVSNEGNATQKSCMICHSAMKDRDLSNTPTPLVKFLVQ